MISMTTYYPDDYYKDGMAINQSLKMDALAKQKNVSARLALLGEGYLELEIRNVTDSAIEMNLYHVTTAGHPPNSGRLVYRTHRA